MFNYPRGKGPKEHLNGDSIKRQRGRPRGSGVDPNKTVASIRVRADTYALVDSWRKDFHVNTFDDAIRAFVQDKIKIRKKLDGLLEGRQPMVVVEPRQNMVELEPNLIDWRQSMR
jgi:hypothetical protein